ncbi:hypothetical protein [Spirillospora sp. NPDC047279]|uniref:hypothetical protein n=1 Tax=Spirillospora sp. NPDC047279 TaxID=3155478 RepID=UPI0034014B7D
MGIAGSAVWPAGRKVTGIQATIHQITWFPSNAQGRFTELEASDLRTRRVRSLLDVPDLTSLTFTIDSAFTQRIPGVHATVIFRNGAGKIIGGSDHGAADVQGSDPQPGRSVRELLLPTDHEDPAAAPAPAAADLGRTEIYVFPSEFP